jgi:hypothetical protein
MDSTGLQQTPNGHRALVALIEAIRRCESSGSSDEAAATLWPWFREAVTAALADEAWRDAGPILRWYAAHPSRSEQEGRG